MIRPILTGALVLSLSGCAGIPMALPVAISAAGGAVTFVKDVLELDTAWHQATPGKTPIVGAFRCSADPHGRIIGDCPTEPRMNR